MDKVGVSTNSSSEDTIAVSYSLAKSNVNQYYLDNQQDFKAPQYVDVLPPKEKFLRGKIESVDEVRNYLFNKCFRSPQ